MNLQENLFSKRKELKSKLRRREQLFGGWVSFSHSSITEVLARAEFDFMFIDMEHSTISIEQAQRIIAASQSQGVPCLPRPVSHSNDFIKPLLESGADGILAQMVESPDQVAALIGHNKYPPSGVRSYGINRAQMYGFDFDEYIQHWNDSSIVMLQIESVLAVDRIESLIKFEEVDGVMIGPLDIAGSLGVPGQTNHPLVIDASKNVIEACKGRGISCGTQVAKATPEIVGELFAIGHNFAILGSDLFILYEWAKQARDLMTSMRS